MRPPRFAVWMFGQLGARAGDELVDLYPGSGAITEPWRRYTGNRQVTGGVATIDARGVASSDGRAPAAQRYELAMVVREQVLTYPINGARCDQAACIHLGRTAEDARLDAERAA